ncbi:MAG TPA: flagellar filament capping protein FliD [Steroidobacteraceae bacterium]|nr:flagellar filament capping protein FliD [Steroidobacteraceae bacterium]
MASITSSGIGSGIDVDSLVTGLVAAEGRAKSTVLDTREAGLQAKLSAYGSFRSALEALKKALEPLKELSKFQGRAVSVGDPKILSVTSSSTAAPGSYNVEVEALASAHKLASGLVVGSSTAVGTGTLTLTLGAASFAIALDSTNNTLAGIRDAINSSSTNPGITATIINETAGSHLVLTSNKTGAANAITVQQTGGDAALTTFVSAITERAPAADSRIVVDTYAFESATNTVTGVVDGITFNLLGVSGQDVTTPVGITYDKTAATKAVNDFVTAYNALMNSIKGLSSYDAKTKVGGALLGDSTLRDFRTALSRERTTAVTGASAAFSTLAEIGITSKLDGTLEVNSTRLDSFIATRFDEVGKLFAAPASDSVPAGGMAVRLAALVEGYTKTDGLIETRTKGLQSSIDEIGQSREALNERLVSVEKRLRAQFNAMDTLVAQLRSTGSFLTQQITSLNNQTR